MKFGAVLVRRVTELEYEVGPAMGTELTVNKTSTPFAMATLKPSGRYESHRATAERRKPPQS